MKKIISLLLALMLMTGSVYIGFAEDIVLDNEIKEDGYNIVLQMIDLFGITDKDEKQILKSALMNLAEEDNDAFYKVLNAIAQSIDEYSCYYSEEEWKEFSKEISGTVGGIGVIAMVVDGCFEVVTLLDGGSAKEVGIDVGDRIIEADGVDITGTKANYASSYITGEIGTTVTIKVLRKSGETVEYTLQRRSIVVPSVASHVYEEEKIAYLKISSFTENTVTEVDKELNEFKNKGLSNLIIDLRYNGGGAMDAGIQTAALFMNNGETVVTTKNKNEETTEYKTDKDGYDFNIVILTNEYTASASEIMTCALVENDHAISIGDTTFGKACAQSLLPLAVGGALRITSLHYYTPDGNYINGVGIKPDYHVDNETYYVSEEDIPALTYLNKFNIGDEHEEVEKIERVLYDLRYTNQQPDKVYDKGTAAAISTFQTNTGLYPYGVCDLTTQTYLINMYRETEFTKDSQLEYAINYFVK